VTACAPSGLLISAIRHFDGVTGADLIAFDECPFSGEITETEHGVQIAFPWPRNRTMRHAIGDCCREQLRHREWRPALAIQRRRHLRQIALEQEPTGWQKVVRLTELPDAPAVPRGPRVLDRCRRRVAIAVRGCPDFSRVSARAHCAATSSLRSNVAR